MTAADPARLRRHVEALASSPRSERHDLAGMQRAWSYIAEHLCAAGWQIEQQPLSFGRRIGIADDVAPGGWWPIRVHRGLRGQNMLATLPGQAAGIPLVIGAHLDSVKGCPGADDNAAGIAVLLELATALRTREVQVPVLLAFFDMEEVGHFGSIALADRIGRRGALGMVNLEMIGFYSDEPGSQSVRKGFRRFAAGDSGTLTNLDDERRGDFLVVMHRKSSAFLARCVSDGARGRLPVVTLQDPRPERWGRRLVTFLVPATSNFDRSDHVPFWMKRIPAVMLTDTANLRNANYHQPTDTPDTLDYDRIAVVVDAVLHLIDAQASGIAVDDARANAQTGER